MLLVVKKISPSTHTHAHIRKHKRVFLKRCGPYYLFFYNAYALNLFYAILSSSMRPIFHLSCRSWTKDVHIHHIIYIYILAGDNVILQYIFIYLYVCKPSLKSGTDLFNVYSGSHFIVCILENSYIMSEVK